MMAVYFGKNILRLLFCGLLLVTLSGCSLWLGNQNQTNAPRRTPPKSARQLVSYPNAVTITTTTDTGSWPMEFASFETSDSPAVVENFYKAALGRDGWVVDAEGTLGNKLALSFSWYDGVKRSNYHYEVIITRTDSGTQVDVKLTNYPNM
jgi:hypothetical protein